MNEGWRTRPLDEVCEVEYGTRVVRKRDGGTAYPVYGGGGATFAMDTFNREDRVVVGRFGMSEECTRFVEGKFFLNDSGLTLAPRDSEVLLQRFLDMWVFSANDTIFSLGKGTAQKNLDVVAFRCLDVPLPPPSEQKRIVTILDGAFEGIATARANAEKNLANARAVFESHLNAVFTERGEGWVEKAIGEVCTLRSGTTVDKRLEKPSGDIPYVKVADMSHVGNETVVVSSSRFLSSTDVGRNAVIPAGATIFPKRGGAIMTNKKRLVAVPICADLNVMGVIPSSRLLPKFLHLFFLTVDMRELGSGSSIPQINNYDIAPLRIAFPDSLAEQERLIDGLERLEVQTRTLESVYQRKLAALATLKQSLLHHAFSGQL